MTKRDRRRGMLQETAPLETSPSALGLYVLGNAMRKPLRLDRTVRIGRDEDCELQLDDASVSRLHAVMEPASDDGQVAVVDRGSRNGTWVGDARVASGGRAFATAGTVVRIGEVALVLDRMRRGPPAPEDSGASELRPIGPMRAVLDTAARLAADDITVLLTGETGVGKEVMARWLHAHSPRARAPLTPVHAAALSPTLFESEIFGHERGAFTGAATDRAGLLEQAEGGTLFFDEIGELPLDLQPKLLRVLEDRLVVRVGGRSGRVVDVRIIAATNRDLASEVAAGRFRADLYFRLNAFPIVVPPLRERREEIALLAGALLEAACAKRSRRAMTFDEAALDSLRAYGWPGNVRELVSVVTRALLMADPGATVLGTGDVARAIHGAPQTPLPTRFEPHATSATERSSSKGDASEGDASGDDERKRIEAALQKHAGNQSAAAVELSMARRTLLYKLDKLGIARPRKRTKKP